MQETASIEITLLLIRPLVRLLARTIDICIATVLVLILLIILDPAHEVLTPLQPFLSLFAWIFIEAFLLSTWGTTPGKWLFDIEVRDKEQKMLNFQQALKRSFKVWRMGLGFGIFLPFMLIISYVQLVRNGISPWDNKCDSMAFHGEMSPIKLPIFALIILYYGRSLFS